MKKQFVDTHQLVDGGGIKNEISRAQQAEETEIFHFFLLVQRFLYGHENVP